MDRTSKHGRAVQRAVRAGAASEIAPGKATLTEGLRGGDTPGGEVAAPSHQWPATTAFVGEQAARAHGLVQFNAAARPPVQRRRDELQEDLDQLAGQSDGEVADDVVHDAAHAEEARGLYQQGQAAYQQRDYIQAGQLFEQAAVANRSERRSALYNAALAYGRALRARDRAAAPRGGRRGRGPGAGAPSAPPASEQGQPSERDLAVLDESPGESAAAIADQASAREDFDQGMRDYRAGEDEAAAQHFEASAARAPEAAGDLNYNAGMAHFRGGDYEAAVRTFRAALGLAGPSADEADGGAAAAPQASPGPAVQRRESGPTTASGSEAEDVHQLADAGMRGPGSELPHLDAIQRSFGHHDVSDVVAHVGGAAADAAAGMNALAYASGSQVAFARAPDLHLAAHEAAHVVQQRGGIQLAGGVGRSGDAFEQHADAVADRVVRGESAQDLLDGLAPGQGRAAAAQRATPVQMNNRRPLRERQVRVTATVTAEYDDLRAAAEPVVARQVMSRTEVEQPGGGRQPIRRERELVESSNLRRIHGTLTPGDQVELIGRLIPGPGGHRYQRLVFRVSSVTGGTDIQVGGRPGVRGIAPPNYEPPRGVPNREDRWRRAQAMLAERLGNPTLAQLGAGPDEMWTPTPTCISRMMPAVVSPTGPGQGGTDVPRQIRLGRPRWRALPTPHSSTVKIFAHLLESRFGTESAVGAPELSDGAIDLVVRQFIGSATAAKDARDQRLAQLGLAGTGGGGSMYQRDLNAYRQAERAYFEDDVTCLWRYV
jgi:TolA-binding protein